MSGGATFIEVNQDVTTSNGLNITDASPDLQMNPALRRLKEQLSLDNIEFLNNNEGPNDLGLTINEQSYSGSEGLQYGSDDYTSLQYPGFFPRLYMHIYNLIIYSLII